MKRAPGSRTRRPVARSPGLAAAPWPTNRLAPAASVRPGCSSAPASGQVRPAYPRGTPPASAPAPLRPGRPRGSGLGRRPGRRACGSFRAPHPSLAARSGAGPTGRPSAPSAVPASRLRPSLRGGGAAAAAAGSSSSRRGVGRAAGPGSLSGPAAGRRGGLAVRPRGRPGGGAALRSGRGDGAAGRPLPQAGGGRTALPASRPRVGAA